MKIVTIGSLIQKARPARLLGLLAGLCLFSNVSVPVRAQSSDTNSSQSSVRHSPTVQTNKIVLPQTPGAQLLTDRSSYATDQTVFLTFKVTNTGKKPITYDFPSGQQAAFSVTDSKGNPVWDSTAARVSFSGITHLMLAPGQSQAYQGKWDERDSHGKPAPPGLYTASADLIPLPRVVVSGGLIVNTDPDPDNTGMPTKDKGESGATLQQDVTPPIAASIQITIRPAEPQSNSHPGSAK